MICVEFQVWWMRGASFKQNTSTSSYFLFEVCEVVWSVCSLCFQVCETYPRDLYVPITASKPIIVGSSKFRSKGRFPVLTYFYQEKKVIFKHTPHFYCSEALWKKTEDSSTWLGIMVFFQTISDKAQSELFLYKVPEGLKIQIRQILHNLFISVNLL